MKTVLFKTYGDSLYGMGHVYRSIALSRFFDSNELQSFFVTDEKTPTEVLKAMENDDRQTINLNTSKKHFDYLIYDMPFLDKAFFDSINLSRFVKKIGLDFFHYESKYIDLALNLFNHKDPKNAPFEVKENIQYAILRDSILLKKPKNNKSNKRKVLITFGSADPKNNVCVVLDKIIDAEQSLYIILGSLYNNETELNKSLSRFSKTEITILKNISNIEDYILRSNLVICGGGTTLLETIYLSRPAIVLAQTSEELNFAKSLAAKNLCRVIEQNSLSQIDLNNFLPNTFTTTSIGMGKKLILNEIMGNIDG